MESYNTYNLNGSPGFGYSQLNLFLDLDNNASTGFAALNGLVGSDVLIQGVGMYRQAAGTWNAGQVGSATASAVTNVNNVTLAVPLSALRSVVSSIGSVRLLGLNDELNSYYPSSRSYLLFSL